MDGGRRMEGAYAHDGHNQQMIWVKDGRRKEKMRNVNT
jgi:hypothetical protein